MKTVIFLRTPSDRSQPHVKRFLLVTNDYPPRVGGVARYHSAIIGALGAQASVLVVKIERGWIWLLPKIIFTLIRTRADALIVGEITPIGTLALILRRTIGIPYVVVCHGLDLRLAARVSRRCKIAKAVLRGASRIIVNSAMTAALARDLDAPAKHVTIVPPPLGVIPELARPAYVYDVRTKFDLENVRIVLSVGRLVARKGFDDLIRAFAIIQRTRPRTALVIIGDGPERMALEEIGRNEHVAVRFLSHRSDAEVAAWYTACDVFALLPRELPNGDVEGFGIVYLEAGAFEKPVVGTQSGGVPEAIMDGENGLLVPPNDPTAAATAISRILADGALAARLGTNGARRVQREFSAERFAERIRGALDGA
ncbi:MAG: glycosyltransferase family 4 protein [Candidatus Uhrbacteria bacterium]